MRTVEQYRQNISICSVNAYNLERGSPTKRSESKQTSQRPYTAALSSPQRKRPESRDTNRSLSKVIDESVLSNNSYISKGTRLIVNKLRLQSAINQKRD